MVAQLLANRNTNDTEINHNEEEHNDDECPKTEKSKESSSIDVEVVKGMLRSDCIPNPKRWAEESRNDSFLPSGVGFCAIPTKVLQATVQKE